MIEATVSQFQSRTWSQSGIFEQSLLRSHCTGVWDHGVLATIRAERFADAHAAREE